MNNVIKLLAISALGMGGQQAQAFSIDFDYSYDTGFFSAERKAVLNSAASYFENRITDNLGAITSSGSNHFNAIFFNPSTPGSDEIISDFSVAANSLVVFVGAYDLAGSSIGLGGPGGFSASGTSQTFFDSFSRGQIGEGTTDFAPWGGSIAFDDQVTWYSDADVSTVESFSGNDLYSVALHELGHLLGIGTADSWHNQVDGGSFIGTDSSAVNGGDVLLHSDVSHWQNGTLSLVDGVSQEAAMDPSIFVGTRKNFTDLDLAGLSDIGWDVVSAVPVPAAVYFFGSALLGLVGFRKKVK